MTIDSRCKEQRDVADIILTNFNSSAPGSKGQVQALSTLSFLLGMWSDFLKAEQRRMKLASSPSDIRALKAKTLAGELIVHDSAKQEPEHIDP